MLRITGYSDTYSVCPGDTVTFYVNSEKNEDYQADIVRLIHGDLHQHNIVLTEEGPRVLDWQTCSLGDPVHDVTRLALESDPGRSFDSILSLCDRRPETRAAAPSAR